MRAISLAVALVFVASVAFAGVTFSKVDDSTMKITVEQETKMTRETALDRKAAIEKALAEINDVIKEMDKLGVTKTASDVIDA